MFLVGTFQNLEWNVNLKSDNLFEPNLMEFEFYGLGNFRI
jgi:hypothetical protein